MDLFIKIAVAVTIIAIASYANIEAIWAWVSSWEAETVMIVTAIASIVIAGIASLATVMQGLYNRAHNRLSVRPLVTSVRDIRVRKDKNGDSLEIRNNGTGPAIIKNVIHYLNDKVLTWDEFHTLFYDNTDGFEPRKVSFIKVGSVLAVEGVQNLWEVGYNPKNQNIDFLNNINIRIEYQSIYEDKLFICDTNSNFELKDK